MTMEDIIANSREFVVLDLETSHFHPKKGGMIIEIGAVKIIDNKIVAKYNQLIDPERVISNKIIELTGITNEMLEGKPKFREVLPIFHRLLGNATVVAHNAQFDWDRFLIHFFKKVGIYPTNPVVDTLALSRKYMKDNKGGHSLGALCDSLNIEIGNAHRALDDAIATAKLFLYIKKTYLKGFSDNTEQASLFKPNNSVKCKNQNVRKVSYWEKKIKDKHFKRLYVTLDRSVVFLDLPTKAWEVKSSNEPIDFAEVEKNVLTYTNCKDIDGLIQKYA